MIPLGRPDARSGFAGRWRRLPHRSGPAGSDPDLIRRWWSPEHFSVVGVEAEAVGGGGLRIVMEEGDGTRHIAAGRYLALTPPKMLSFELAPLGPDGVPLLSAVHHLRLTEQGASTTLSLTIKVTHVTSGATAALAGIRLGWGQLLDRLARDVAG